MRKIDRTGEKSISSQGYLMKIIKYNNHHDILIKFLDDMGAIVKGDYSTFKKGLIKNPYHKTMLDIGYIGETTIMNENNIKKKSYYCWKGMMSRCYYNEFHKKQPTYIGCSVCEDWHCFATFEKWFNENYYEIEGEEMQLDKDILCHNLKIENKIYSPETCVFLPRKFNNLFERKKSNKKNKDLPKGVTFKHGKYVAQFSFDNKENGYLGRFDTPEKAFECYKEAKENEIKRIANEYKDKIPQILYEAMYNYKVEITD